MRGIQYVMQLLTQTAYVHNSFYNTQSLFSICSIRRDLHIASPVSQTYLVYALLHMEVTPDIDMDSMKYTRVP